MMLHAVTLGAALLAPAAEAKGDKGLEAAAKKAAGMASYALVFTGPSPAKGVEAKYQKGQPLWCKADGIEFYRKGDVLVYLDGGAWKRSKTGVESDPLRVLGAAAAVRRVPLPHEELPGLVKDLTAVKKADGKLKGSAVYTGTLSREAAKKWAPTEVRGVAQGGTVQVWVEPGGVVVRYAVLLRVKGRLGGAEVDGTSARSVELRAVGSTKVDPPAAAKKALE
jgi:hypothetical protein